MLQPMEWVEGNMRARTSPKGLWRQLGYVLTIMGSIAAFGITLMLR